MRLARFNDNRIGIVRKDGVHDITTILQKLPAVRYPFPVGDPLIANLEAWRDEMEGLADKAPAIDPAECEFKSPVANPSKVIGVPTNYQAHREEMAADKTVHAPSAKLASKGVDNVLEQGLFLKNGLVGPSEGVAVRFPDRRTDHEAELGVIIGKTGSDIPEEKAYDYIVGYALALDMVVRGKEDRSFRKAIDTYGVLGPWLVTKDEVPDPQKLDFELKVNGESRQKANTSEMIMYIKQQISWGSSFYTLHPGDVIMTGTCQGVGRVQPGDKMDFEFPALGKMEIAIRAHKV
jgi:2,4-diketo-3-deoxy-L-fuconate hydrolase